MIQGKKFRFIRHAQTEWNEKKLCQGLKDIPLSSMGRESSFQIGKRLPEVEFIVSSPLARALETAKIIQSFHPKAKLEIIDDLKERGYGRLEGDSSEKMYQIEGREEADPNYSPGLEIEPRDSFRKRVVSGINQALEFHPNPLIVSHGRLFLTLCDVLQIPTIRQIPNLMLFEFVKVNSKWDKHP